jgi:ferrous iron transport protein B
MFCYAIFGPKLGGLVLFGIYVFGFVFGLVVAKVISFFYNRKNDNFYSGEDMFEIYDYRIPKVSRILTFAFAKVKDYFKNAATLILFSSFIFSILLSVNTSFGQASTASESIIARLASFVMPVFERIGFSWEMTVSVFSGLVAKEVSISTLAVLYGVSGSGVSISSVISSSISFASGVSMICFMFFYLPCVSATSVFYKELKDFSKVLILFLISFSLAFGSSFLAYYLLK